MKLPERVSDGCVRFLECVAKSRDVSLRDVGKILSRVALLPNAVHEKNQKDGYIDILCALLVTSVIDPRLHAKLVSGDAQTSELRAYLFAPAEKTVQRIGDDDNSEYDHEVAIRLATIVFCCGFEELSDVEDLPDLSEQIDRRFSDYGVRDRKSIAKAIQKDFVDLFRI